MNSLASSSIARRLLAAGALLVCLCGPGCSRLPKSAPAGPLTAIEQVRRLTPEEAAAQLQVHLRGAITFSEGSLHLLFMQDATGAVRIEGAPIAGMELFSGRTIDLTGVTSSSGSDPAVRATNITLLDRPSALPAPVRCDARRVMSGELQYQFVEIEGVVRSATMQRGGRITVVVHALDRDIEAYVSGLHQWDYHSLVDSVVRVRGVLGERFDARGVPSVVTTWVMAFRDITTVKPAPSVEEVPARTVASVRSLDLSHPPEHRVRLRGSVSMENGRLVLRDSTGAVPLQPAPSESLGTGLAADVLGFVGAGQGGTPVLTGCVSFARAREERNPQPLPVLTAIGQVKKLTEDQARQRYPVHLRGVVTYRNPAAGNAFVQDETGGVYLFIRRGAEPQIRLGDLVEIDGSVSPGDFAPLVSAARISVIGRRPVPTPLRVHMEELFTGFADGRWIEALGVVHSIRLEGDLAVLGVSWGIHRYTVYVYGSGKLPESLLDSHVRLLGVCGSLFNFKRQILGLQMYVPDPSFIQIEEREAHGVPPLQAIDQLLEYSPDSHFGDRSRIRGVVTLTHSSGPTYISGPTASVVIQEHAPVTLEVGDLVEATGFATAVPGTFNPVMRDAEIQKVGHEAPPEPVRLTSAGILEGGHDAELVQLDAVLVDQSAAKGSPALVLQAGERLFAARIDNQLLPPLEKGSLLRITGITSLETQESEQILIPRAFSIQLRSPADVVVLRAAPWWTTQRTFRVLGLICAVALSAFAWIFVLRRRVRQQTADLRGSRQMLQLVLDHIPQRVFWKDREGRYLGCNRYCAIDAGVPTPQAIVGKSDRDLSWRTAADLYLADDREVMETGQPKIGYEETLTTADGRRLWVRTSKAPLPGSNGAAIGILGTYEDITEHKRAEERLQHYSAQLAETNSELKRFTYVVSHDLRAPLLSLKGFAFELRSSVNTIRKPLESLLESLDEQDRAAVTQALNDAIPEAVGFIESSVSRMDSLIAALLRLSRVGYREFLIQELDTEALVGETLRTLAYQIESRNITVKTGPLPRITSDRAAMEQIFANLLDNAVKYLDPVRPGQIEISAEETAEIFIFHVRDNGRGIAEDDMDKVFAPFRRAGPQDVPGEGMGLAFVRALLHRLGGRIECESQLGAGTRFSFALPKSR